MASPGPDVASGYKPLPSVGVVLLSRDLRALRARYAAAAAIVASLGVAAVLGVFGGDLWTAIEQRLALAVKTGWPGEGGPTATASVAGTTATSGNSDSSRPPDEPARATETAMGSVPAPATLPPSNAREPDGNHVVRFGTAGTFREALRAAGCSTEETSQLVDALEGIWDFRRCRPEHELVFGRDEGGTLVSFEYRAGVIESIVARRDDADGFSAERVLVPIERRRIARGALVTSSLGRALDSLGLGRNLAGAFVEAFEGRLDFAKGMRPGDSFRIVVDEEYVDGDFLRYGAVHAIEYTGARTGRLRAYWFQGKDRRGDFHDEKGRAIHGGWLRTPLRYDRLSSGFNLKRVHPILKRIVPHLGIDYAAAPGTPVWAAGDGVVTFAGERGANGNLVAIKHAGGYETYYAHLSRIARGIKVGAPVSQRDPIGAVGSTGRSTGPHLHFALKRYGRFLDPKRELNGPGRPLPGSLMPRFRQFVTRTAREFEAIPLAAVPGPTGLEPDDAGDSADEVFHEDTLDL